MGSGSSRSGSSHPRVVNQHCAYRELSKPDRRALRDLLKLAFPIGGSSHALWSDFLDTTAFVRRFTEPAGTGLAEGILGGAIVMSYPADQYDYLAYIAIHPDYRHHRRFFGGGQGPHHGTALLHEVYEVMRGRVGPDRLQRYLIIEPAGDDALRFYLRALPANLYPVRFDPVERVLTVGYDGLAL